MSDIDMDEDDELVQVHHLVPASVKEQAHENRQYYDEGLSGMVRDLYRMVAQGLYVDEQTLALRKQLAEERIGQLESEQDRLETRVGELRKEKQSLEEDLGGTTPEDKFEEQLEALEERIYGGMRVFPGHGRVEDLAAVSEHTPGGIIELLKERNPSLVEEHPEAFESGLESKLDYFGAEHLQEADNE